MIAQTTELPPKPTYTLETVIASQPGRGRTAIKIIASFAETTSMGDEQRLAAELIRPPAMVQAVIDYLDEPVSG